MTDITGLKDGLNDVALVVESIAGDVDSLINQVAVLKEQLSTGVVATQEDLDQLGATVASIKARLVSVDSKEPAPEVV